MMVKNKVKKILNARWNVTPNIERQIEFPYCVNMVYFLLPKISTRHQTWWPFLPNLYNSNHFPVPPRIRIIERLLYFTFHCPFKTQQALWTEFSWIYFSNNDLKILDWHVNWDNWNACIICLEQMHDSSIS